MLLNLYSTANDDIVRSTGTRIPAAAHTVLRSDQGIEKVLPVLAFQRDNLPTSSTAIWFQIKGLPQVVYRCWSWIRSNIEQDTDTDRDAGQVGFA